jgi:hypothetical protein
MSSSKNAASKRKRGGTLSPNNRSSPNNNNKSDNNNNNTNKSKNGADGPIGYVLECDAPVKQFVQYNDSTRHDDKKWIITDLDDTHLLVQRKYQTEIINKVNEWMDSNVFSSVEKVGEDLDIS